MLKTHTLAMLEHYKIPKKQIYIFVANAEELAEYKAVITDTGYNWVIGILCLKEQRNFITNYFKEGVPLLNIDDDIKSLFQLDASNKSLVPLNSLIELVNKGFKDCIEYKAYLWGIYQVNNGYFMRDSTSFNFSFIVGHFWGCINRKTDELNITIDIKEDYERSIKYWLKDKCIVKYNYISAETKIYDNPGGLQVAYPDRAASSLASAELLLNTYPDYFDIRINRLNNTSPSRYIELKTLKHISDNNYYKALTGIDKDDDLIKSILDILDNTNLAINTSRLNSGKGMSQCFGLFRVRKKKGLHTSLNNAKYPILYDILLKFYEKYVKEHMPVYTSIQVNKNYKTTPHYDRNAGNSYIVGLGNYSGGDLIVNNYCHNIRYQPILFEGSKWLHSTNDFKGNRYSLVFFNQRTKN
jgi:hypothetical protein